MEFAIKFLFAIRIPTSQFRNVLFIRGLVRNSASGGFAGIPRQFREATRFLFHPLQFEKMMEIRPILLFTGYCHRCLIFFRHVDQKYYEQLHLVILILLYFQV